LHIYDLVALAFDGRHDAAAAAEKHTLRAVRLRAIKTDIAESLDRGSDLSVGEIAARQRVSARYIQMLFDGEGTTFTQFVLRERLARAHRLLTDPSLPDRGIAAVAYAAGFGDLSYFIRAFRREFGASPSQIRSGALHQACRPGSLCA
jgi:AraC-like DNA-binding protein